MTTTVEKISYLEKVNPDKRALMEFAFRQFSPRPRTFADLGGVWGVDGAYTMYAMNELQCARGCLVDTHPTGLVTERVAQTPGLTFVHGNFGSPAVIAQVPRVDCIFLFDVLLHQVNPHWHDILRLYAGKTDCFVIYNQQWTGSVTTTRLLDLGPEGYFANTPHEPAHPAYRNLFGKLNDKHPDHDRTWRDVHHIWQWGITDAELGAVMASLGYELFFFANHGRFGNLPGFENHAFVWRRQT